jgi:hypothetical protein
VIFLADGKPKIDLLWLLSGKDYWYATVSALLGALIGISWTKRQFKRLKENEKRRCVSRLRESLQFNVDRLNQAHDQLQGSVFPNYPLDTAQLNHWLTEAHDLLPAQLLKNLDWHRYQLDHISSKFQVASNFVVLTAGRELTSAEQGYVSALKASLIEHIDGVRNALPPLIQQIPKQ